MTKNPPFYTIIAMENTADFMLLRQMDFFKPFLDEEIKKLMEVAFIKDYPTGAVLFNEGMDGDVMYIVVSGEVDIIKKNDQKESVLLAKIKAGSFFGEMSLLENEKRSASAKISFNTKMLVITRRTFDRLLEIEPKITSKLLTIFLRVLSSRLRAASTLK